MAQSERKVVYTVNFYWALVRLEEEADAVNLAVSVFSDRRCLSLPVPPRESVMSGKFGYSTDAQQLSAWYGTDRSGRDCHWRILTVTDKL